MNDSLVKEAVVTRHWHRRELDCVRSHLFAPAVTTTQCNVLVSYFIDKQNPVQIKYNDSSSHRYNATIGYSLFDLLKHVSSICLGCLCSTIGQMKTLKHTIAHVVHSCPSKTTCISFISLSLGFSPSTHWCSKHFKCIIYVKEVLLKEKRNGFFQKKIINFLFLFCVFFASLI